ncbi:hypothetical protein J132_11089 [Termitomyces sp. J132]|nr:hypothetical protein J132_11089 [Termitomyces sp. J132]
MEQLVRMDDKLVVALEKQKQLRTKSVDHFNEKYVRFPSKREFDEGTWVLVHETWSEGQKKHRFALRWTDPYIVHKRLKETTYQVRKLDGTERRESVAARKIFYYREEFNKDGEE